MPETFGYDLVHFFHVASLAVIVGGGLALGSAAAPTLFRTLDRSQAGTVFGAVLERWDGVAILASLVLVATTAILTIAFETGEPILPRWVAVGVVLLGTLYASAWANPIARGLRRSRPDFDDLPSSADERREFARYHSRSTRAMSVAILAGLVALWFS
ncbi:MAG TPA: DUF4149 domain-containing protein [Candidatus Dormibacteraeota bacterium]|nr:DUF4149 domain-containing protein [Candidatus Dormibacteraeota bacterium]